MGLPAEKLRIRPLLSVHRAATRYDPTKTLHLRNVFARAFRVRFAKLKAAIRKVIVDEDCFGLNSPDTGPRITIHQAFNFPRSQEKVQGFMAWLQAQVDAGILETSRRPQIGTSIESHWSDVYIQDSYQRGVQRARYELAHAGYGVPSMEATGGVMASMSLSFHSERVGLLFSRTYNELKGITAAMDSQIGRVLAQGMADGDGARVLAKKLLQTVSGVGDLSLTDTLGRFIPAEQRAAMLARTETIRAFHTANVNEMRSWGVEGVKIRAEWKTAGFHVCPKCSALEGKEFTLDEISGMIPVHPNCVIADTRISPVSVIATSKRWYDGEVVIIGTSGGKHLTCTPNHPVLTNRGWIAADLLNVGDNVVCGFQGNWDSPISGHNQDVPATIKEISKAFGSSPQVVSREVPGASPDFHSDGVQGNVTVIWANRILRDKRNAGYAQEAPQDQFMAGNIARSFLKSLGTFNLFLNRHVAASCGLMRRLYLTALGFGCHLCPLPALCFGLGAGGDSMLSENPVDYDTGHPEFQMKGIGGHPRMKSIANLFFRNSDKVVVSQCQPGFQDDPLDDFVSYIETQGNHVDGFPGKIPLDDIVSLRREFFSGHVYNLQTSKGYYIAEGIATHNCRCLALPVDMTGK